MIYDVRNDFCPLSTWSGTLNVLQVWTSRTGVINTSSKYGWGVLDILLFMLESWNLAHMSRITYHDNPWGQERPHPPSLQSGAINIFKVLTSRIVGSWHTSIHARELKFGTQVKNHISWWSMMSRMIPSSKSPVRNYQHPPSMDLKEEGGFLTHF